MMDALKDHVTQMAKFLAIDEIKVHVTQMATADTAEQNYHDPDSELYQASSHGNALISKSLLSMTGAQSYQIAFVYVRSTVLPNHFCL